MILQYAHEAVTDDIFLTVTGLTEESTELFVKLEGLNPAGSVKLKSAVGMIDDAERRGRLAPGMRIIESTSGSMGIALAIVAAERGYALSCVTDPNISPHSRTILRALGAEIIEVNQRDGNGGFLGSRIAVIHERLTLDPTLVWLNQYANAANTAAHSTHTAASTLNAIGHIDFLFVGAGTTGTLMGCVRHFRAFSPWTKVIAVDTEGSVTFADVPAPRHIPGLGTSRRPELCRPDAVDDVVLVGEAEAVRMCRRLARERGLFLGGSTGSVLAAVERYSIFMPEGSRVVALSPDMGDRYVQTVYDDAWVSRTFGSSVLDDRDAVLSQGM